MGTLILESQLEYCYMQNMLHSIYATYVSQMLVIPSLINLINLIT